MEPRHLRYFVAVVDSGGLTVAAEQKLNTSQPSLSRQIRDLEEQVGTPLMIRSAQGIELTSAGNAFLDHARLALVEAAHSGHPVERCRSWLTPNGKCELAQIRVSIVCTRKFTMSTFEATSSSFPGASSQRPDAELSRAAVLRSLTGLGTSDQRLSITRRNLLR